MHAMLNTEPVVTLDEVVGRLPVGVRRNRSTVWRWCRVGIRGVRLEQGFAGGTIVTSMEAIDRFFRAVSEARELCPPAERPPSRHSRNQPQMKRRSSIEDAEAFLAGLGV
jgi:hypothetical protein